MNALFLCKISCEFLSGEKKNKKKQKVKVENMRSATALPINEALSLNEVELKMSL